MGYKRSVEDKKRGKKNINAKRRARSLLARAESQSEVWVALSKQDQEVARVLDLVIESGKVKYNDWVSSLTYVVEEVNND